MLKPLLKTIKELTKTNTSLITIINCSETLLLFFLPFSKSLMNEKHENENRKKKSVEGQYRFFIYFLQNQV